MLKSVRNGLLGLIGFLGACSEYDVLEKVPREYIDGVKNALVVAGDNSKELLDTLNAFRNNPEKLEAASFLISETPRRMHRKHPVDWSWDLAHKDHTEINDSKVVKSCDLIDNVNWAFVARDRFPWARDLYTDNKGLFFSGVLPYRLGTASLDQLPGIGHWRGLLLDEHIFNAVKERHGLKTEFRDVQKKLDELAGLYDQAHTPAERGAVLTEFAKWVEVDFMAGEGLRYFPRGPEEKTLDVFLTPEMKDGQIRRGGRCTDGDNNSRYLYMSAGVPTPSVRFIAWPKGDDNHEVIRVNLPGQPFDMSTCIFDDKSADMRYTHGPVGKVYEEKWGIRDASSELVWNLKEGEKLPWYIGFYLRTRSTTDVTGRYGPTTKVNVRAERPDQLVYLGVMNNNSDTQLGTATVAITRADRNARAEFNQVGSDNLFYIPYSYEEINGKSFARAVDFPFALRDDGSIRIFGFAIDNNLLTSRLNDLKPGKNYNLERFAGDSWSLDSEIVVDKEGSVDVRISPYHIYTLRDSAGSYSRPFTLTDGKIEKF